MTEQQRIKPRRSLGAVLIEFLGSMNLAITLLMVIAVASVIGTVLQQNEPYNNYVMKFGPFWFEVYRSLSLYDVYGATWFMLLLGFLLVSTSVCVYRNAPSIMRDMRQFRLDVQSKSLRAFHHQDEWPSPQDKDQVLQNVRQRLEKLGYRTRTKQHADHITLAGMKGSVSRLGYLLSHVAIVVICIGGLIDGNIMVRIGEWRGDIVAETRDIPVSQVPSQSILPPENPAFRGSVNIPEGARANFIFLSLRDGYLVQNLPFTIELEEFRIEHYPSGQPKSYESTLLIHDPELDEPLRKVIAVNHPLIYKGHAIYQASFSDGGSILDLTGWSLDRPELGPQPIRARENPDQPLLEGRMPEVGSQLQLNTPRGPYTLELSDFQLFNIFPNEEEPIEGVRHSPYRNFGPSMTFKLRSAAGDAREYINYQAPIPLDGRYYFLSGMRSNPNDDYRYLHIPVDQNGSIEGFMKFLALARDRELVQAVARRHAEIEMGLDNDPEMLEQFSSSVANLVRVFVEEGVDVIVEQTERTVPEAERANVLSSYIGMIQSILGTLYLDMLSQDGLVIDEITEQQADFFDDTMQAMTLIPAYDAPLYLVLNSFEHVEASGLQITKAPGENIVYLGSLMLMLGILFMFYIHHRRLWVMVREEAGKTQILFAASGHRQRNDFDREFAFLKDDLRQRTDAQPDSK